MNLLQIHYLRFKNLYFLFFANTLTDHIIRYNLFNLLSQSRASNSVHLGMSTGFEGGQESLLKIKLNIRMRWKGDLSDFDCDIVVGETGDLLTYTLTGHFIRYAWYYS